jgi:hypothetical protein
MRDQRSTPTRRPTGRLLRWVLVVTVGEAIGFMVPAIVGLRWRRWRGRRYQP